MKLVKRIAFLFLLVHGTASAVEYTLPSGADVSLAQLQSISEGYKTVCDTDTISSSVCDVEPGRYQLVVYDAQWQAERSEVTIAASSTGSSAKVMLVTESCFGGPNTQMGCTASCPTGSIATGGACDVSDGFSVSSVAGEDFYRCPTALPPNDTSVGVTASVYCLTSD